MKVPVVDQSGGEVGSVELDPAEISPEINKQLLHDVVVMYETNRRVGTVRQKSRGEVAYSTKKLYRQKGTGRARAGSRSTNIRRGGGRAFARRPVDYGYRLPKKAVRLATRMALRSKFEDNQVTILDKLELSEPKTKQVATLLKALGLDATSCLLTIPEHDANVWRSARNIARLQVSPARDLNAYDLLHQRQLVLTEEALDLLRSGGSENGNGKAAEESTGEEH